MKTFKSNRARIGAAFLLICGAVGVVRAQDGEYWTPEHKTAMLKMRGAEAVNEGADAANSLGQARWLDLRRWQNKLMEDGTKPADAAAMAEVEAARRGAAPIPEELSKGREVSGDVMARGYTDAASDSAVAKEVFSATMMDFWMNQGYSRTLAQQTAGAASSSVRLQAQTVAQNQKLIEQNAEIIALLKAKK